jgi:hypothetical protein
VGLFVVGDAESRAVPEYCEPAVGECARRGVVVAVAGGDLGVVEASSPAGALQAAEGRLLDGVAEVAVVGQAAGYDVFAAAAASGDRGAAGIALQGVGCAELLDVFADFAGDPGGETITQAGMLR